MFIEGRFVSEEKRLKGRQRGRWRLVLVQAAAIAPSGVIYESNRLFGGKL
jgi:hypothetical protein